MKSIFITFALLFIVFFAFKRAISMDFEEKSLAEAPAITATAVFAGGCFWCVESDFEKVEGVVEAISGYTGGQVENPTYKQVSSGATGHVEAVKVVYDPAKVSYGELLEVLWRHIDPTDSGGQFADRGSPYRTAIFYANAEEKRLAEASRKRLSDSGRFDKAVVTPILPLEAFYPAEAYHQDYYQKNPLRYKFYRSGSGRDRFLESAWPDSKTDMNAVAKPAAMDAGMKTDGPTGIVFSEKTDERLNIGMGEETLKTTESGGMTGSAKDEMMASALSTMAFKPMAYVKPGDEELKGRLTPLQYRVTQENGTEQPFNNEFWDNQRLGIYTDVVSGEPLFSSLDKFKSGTGWPSFIRPLEPENVVELTDTRFFMVRTEVRSRHGDSHLGHLFDDGPAPTGLRYCLNSAALRFIPVEDLEKEGYGEYQKLFENDKTGG